MVFTEKTHMIIFYFWYIPNADTAPNIMKTEKKCLSFSRAYTASQLKPCFDKQILSLPLTLLIFTMYLAFHVT